MEVRLNDVMCLMENDGASKSQVWGILERMAREHSLSISVIGGVALGSYNYVRFTHDIDMLISVNDAYKLAESLLASGEFQDVGQNEFLHDNGVIVNLCPEGVEAGRHRFPAPEASPGTLEVVRLPVLMALKIDAYRYRDRADYVELVKRNDIDRSFVEREVVPLVRSAVGKAMALQLFDEAQNEVS